MIRPCKIVCENWYWNRKLQVALNEQFGVVWGVHKEFKPFNTRHRGKYLFLQQNTSSGVWWFSWGTEYDFANCDLPQYFAKELLEELAA